MNTGNRYLLAVSEHLNFMDLAVFVPKFSDNLFKRRVGAEENGELGVLTDAFKDLTLAIPEPSQSIPRDAGAV